MASLEEATATATETTSASHREEEAGSIATSKQNAGTDMNKMANNTKEASDLSQTASKAERVATRVEEGIQRKDLDKANTANTNLQSNSSDNSTVDSVASPPTSSSEGFSSQSTNQDGPMSQLSQLSQLAAAQQPLTNTATRPNLSISPTAGQKRMADGQIKENISNSPMSPRVRGHSRNASAVSNVSSSSNRLGEVRLGAGSRGFL